MRTDKSEIFFFICPYTAADIIMTEDGIYIRKPAKLILDRCLIDHTEFSAVK